MSDRIPLGETRGDAISRVQERLGPATSRPLAEQTFWALARKGKITMDTEGAYLIEADLDDKSMRDTATATIQAQHQQHQRSRGGLRHFSVSHKNMYHARVSTSWKATMSSFLAPTLDGAEGYTPPSDDPTTPNSTD